MAEPVPPMVLRDLWRIAESPQHIAWQPFRDGVDIYPLYGGGVDAAAAALLRYAPGASVPTHEHSGFEHIIIISGAQQDEHGEYPAGSLVVNPPGSRHSVRSDGGCIALLIWERPVRFV